jgi:radical SAM superfamily enzyme YgiQ (UPF0313 family)
MIGRPASSTQFRRYQRKVRSYLSDQDFDILALSCWTSLSYQATLSAARVCRELFPEKLVVVGGYHPSALPMEFVTEDNAVDYVICGEGELALKEIADTFATVGRPAETVIVKGKTFALEHFVGYKWELVDDLVRAHYPDGMSNLFIYLSRGCPFGCSFCMEPLKDKSWRAFSPGQSVSMMSAAVERYRSKAVAICDACFGMRRTWRTVSFVRLVDMQCDFCIVFKTRTENHER